MPVVRDISWSFESGTGDAGVVVPAPAYEAGDLLLAFVQSDTGSPTVTSASWAQVLTNTNTTNLTILRKIATASLEPQSYSFAATVNETYNAAVVSIRDVDQVTPINTSSATAQASAAKYAFHTISTTRDNCLILCAAANSAVGVPSIIEGPTIGILGADGAAESQGIGWTFKQLSGSTNGITTSISCSNVAAGAGVKALIAINPPTGSSAIVPTYCASDNSKYINPINGVTAYNGDAALAATADTLIGTSLNGVTVSDATVAAVADFGLNSFHSVGQLTSVVTTNWSGAALDLAAGNNFDSTGKNMLVHLGPSTTGQMQRFPPVSSNKKGIAIGMMSTTNNWKAWYVHGAGTAWGSSRDIPIVFNESAATGTVLQSAGTFNPAATDTFGFWVSSTAAGAAATVWQFYSLWMLDTTTVAGGCAAEPVDIAGIVNASATGHERRSTVIQGANQMLVLQPLQFGDGGTNPIYMDLNSTAIEFPEQYNLSKKRISYISADNVAGLTYYAGPTDTIKHRSSVISSPSKYHWRIHTGSSVSASYDFSGLSIIGAGDVQLRPVTTFTEMTFDTCGSVFQNSASISYTTFKNPTSSSLLVSNNPGLISNCSFTTTTTGSNAIQIIASGAYTFTANTFTGFSTQHETLSSSIYNNATGSLNLISTFSHVNQDSTVNLTNTAYTSSLAQAFSSSAGGIVSAVTWYLKKTGAPTGFAYAKLYAHAGSFGTTSTPTGAALATSAPIKVADLTTSYQIINFPFSGSNLYTLTPSTNYVASIEYTEGTVGNTLDVGVDLGSPVAASNASYFSGSAWTATTAYDVCYNIYKNGIVTLNITGGGSNLFARNAIGCSTTINNNVLITLTGLKNPSEVRVYNAGSTTEIAGQENVTGGTFAFSVGASTAVDMSILSLGYQNQRVLNYSSATDATLPIVQTIDRQYQNS